MDKKILVEYSCIHNKKIHVIFILKNQQLIYYKLNKE